MTIHCTKDHETVTLAPVGRLDTASAPALEKEIDAAVAGGARQLILDMRELAYTSSAGLRVILRAQKQMTPLGGMKVTHVSDDVMEIFDITGFLDILTIE